MADQATEFRAFVATGFPVYVGVWAGLGRPANPSANASQKGRSKLVLWAMIKSAWSIKPRNGVMSMTAFDHLVADTGKPGNFCRDETRGLAKATMDANHVTNCAVFDESEGDVGLRSRSGAAGISSGSFENMSICVAMVPVYCGIACTQ